MCALMERHELLTMSFITMLRETLRHTSPHVRHYMSQITNSVHCSLKYVSFLTPHVNDPPQQVTRIAERHDEISNCVMLLTWLTTVQLTMAERRPSIGNKPD